MAPYEILLCFLLVVSTCLAINVLVASLVLACAGIGMKYIGMFRNHLTAVKERSEVSPDTTDSNRAFGDWAVFAGDVRVGYLPDAEYCALYHAAYTSPGIYFEQLCMAIRVLINTLVFISALMAFAWFVAYSMFPELRPQSFLALVTPPVIFTTMFPLVIFSIFTVCSSPSKLGFKDCFQESMNLEIKRKLGIHISRSIELLPTNIRHSLLEPDKAL